MNRYFPLGMALCASLGVACASGDEGAAPSDEDSGTPLLDSARVDTAIEDARRDGSVIDANADATSIDSASDAGVDAATDSASDASIDSAIDAAVDSALDTSTDSAIDSATDSAIDSTIDSAIDSGAADSTAIDAVTLDTRLDAPLDTAPACTGRTGVFGGSTAASSAFGAMSTGGLGVGAWIKTSSFAESVLARPTMLNVGFDVAFRASSDKLMHGTLASATNVWSIAQIATATTRAQPTLVTFGDLQVIYQGSDFKHYHGRFHLGAWDAASDLVGSSATPAFGPSEPTAAVASAVELEVLWTSDAAPRSIYESGFAVVWSPPRIVSSTVNSDLPPPCALSLPSDPSMLLVYPRATDRVLVYSSRPNTGSPPTWTAPLVVDATAKSNDQVSLTMASSGLRVVMAWRDLDGKGYWSTQSTLGTGSWSSPAPLVSGTNPALASAPSIARGVCGDDAVVTFVTTAGDVQVTRLRAASLSTPETVVSLGSGTGFAAIATAP